MPNTISPPSTLPGSPSPSVFSRSIQPPSFIRNEQISNKQQQNTPKQTTMSQGKSPHTELGHGNPTGKKEVPRAGQRVRDPLIPTVNLTKIPS